MARLCSGLDRLRYGGVLPTYLATTLAIIAAAFGMAALPVFRASDPGREHHILPHPAQPASMVAFVALPTLLFLLTLARLGIIVDHGIPLNAPSSAHRWANAPRDAGIRMSDGSGALSVTEPHTAAAMTREAARRAGSPEWRERALAVGELAWWTGVCPDMSRFTVPHLIRALQDVHPRVRGAAVVGLGSAGAHGAPALTALRSLRGTSVPHLDHLIDEAVFLIDHSPRWEPATGCDGMGDPSLTR